MLIFALFKPQADYQMNKKTAGILIFVLLSTFFLFGTEKENKIPRPHCFFSDEAIHQTQFNLAADMNFFSNIFSYPDTLTGGKSHFYHNFNFSLSKQNINPVNSPKKKENKKYLGKAILFNLGIWLIDSIRYWATYSQWIEDWQFELTWEDQKKRFFSFTANKFDSNPFITNWTHVLSGAIYYNVARYYGLNKLESILFEFSSSLWWEYVTEWREVISINDNFFSGIGGLPFGEVLYRLGSYFSNRPGALNKIVGYVFNPVMALNDLLGSSKWKKKPDFPESSRPLFKFYYGPKQVSYRGEKGSSSLLFNLGLEADFNTIPDYGKTGTTKQWIKKTLLSQFHLDATLGENTLEEYSVLARVVLFGYFSQKIKPGPSKTKKGYSLYIGAGSAFDLFKKKAIAYYDQGDYHYDFTAGEYPPQPTEFTDKFAIINLIGPVFDLVHYSGCWTFKLGLGIHFDFALVNALALNEYSKYYDLSNPQKKSTLTHYGYYYAFGLTLSSEGSLAYKNIELSGKCKYQSYNSIQGLDRFQDEVVDDSEVKDSRFMYKVCLAYSFGNSPFKMEIAYEGINRHGSLKDINQNRLENRIYTRIKIEF